jgi:hypothetical protein
VENTSIVCTATGLPPGQSKIMRLITGQTSGRSFLKNVQSFIYAHLASNSVATGASFPRIIRPETEADHFSPTNFRLKMIAVMI